MDVEEHEVGEGFVADDLPVADAHGDAVVGWGDVGAPEEGDGAGESFSCEGGEDADAIDGAVFGLLEAGDVEDGGEEVGADDGDVAGGAGFDVTGPAGDADAAFVIAALASAEAAGGAAFGARGWAACAFGAIV